jgi:DNA-binding GntR family transcriptional regulator
MAAISMDNIERSATLTAQVGQRLREAIAAGVFAPGDRLTIRSVAAALGVSPTPAREALNILATEGSLESGPSRSIIVPQLSVERLHEITEIRVSLEGLAAETAAGLLDAAGIAEIVRANDAMTAATEAQDFKLAMLKNREFHFGLYRGARMPMLSRLIEGLWLRTGAYINLIYPAFGLAKKGIENHRAAAAALEARDGKALRAAIEQDIRYASAHLEAELKTKERNAA